MKKKFIKLFIGTSIFLIPIFINKLISKAHKTPRYKLEEEKIYKWIYGDINYITKGNGEPIFLIHGIAPGCSILEWENVINILSKYYKVYAIDLLGFGKSQKSNITYSSYLYVSLINDFIKDIIKEKTYAIATSNSANFVVMANSLNENLFKKILLICPSGIKESKKAPSKRLNMLLDSPYVGTTIYNIITSKMYSKFALKNMVYKDPLKVTKELIDKYNHNAHIGGVNAKYPISALMSNFLDVDIKHSLKNIKIPTNIIVNNSYDNKIINDINENVSISYIKNTKLLPQHENPKEFLKLCKNIF